MALFGRGAIQYAKPTCRIASQIEKLIVYLTRYLFYQSAKFTEQTFVYCKKQNILKKYKTPFVIQHSQGSPETMQKNPKYKNELLDIYDFFEQKIISLRSFGIKHNNIILDPGIGFGKNLKHNMNLINNISIFHSLGFPILVGNSRKKFIKELSGKNDTKKRIGGTVASSIYLMMQGVQILRVHEINEVRQGIKVFKEIIK